MAQQGGQRRRGHARDAGRLAQGRGPDGGQLRAAFGRKPADRGVVERGRQVQGLVAAEGQDIGLLAIEIAGIAAVDLDLLGDVRRRSRELRPEAGQVGEVDSGMARSSSAVRRTPSGRW